MNNDVLNKPPSKQILLLIQYAVALLRTDRYFVRYYEILAELGQGKTREAFYQLEAEVYHLTQLTRYSDYQSFRQMRKRYALRKTKPAKKIRKQR